MTDLTSRQLQVAQLVRDGWTDKQIAAKLGVTQQRVSRLVWQIVKAWELDTERDVRVQIALRAA